MNYAMALADQDCGTRREGRLAVQFDAGERALFSRREPFVTEKLSRPP